MDCFVTTKVPPRNDVCEFGIILIELAITSYAKFGYICEYSRFL